MIAIRLFLTRLPLFLLVLLGTGGCSLFNPHHLNVESVTNPSMPIAIGYADDHIGVYRKGMGDQANLNSWTGAALIPLSAVTIALGIQGGHSNAITNLALGGAATYGLSTWLSSPNRSKFYAEGINAMNCAKQAMLPYSYSQDWKVEFDNALNNLSILGQSLTIQLAELKTLTSDLESLVPANDPQVNAAKALIDSVTRLLADTSVTRQNGFILDRRLELAGQTLVFAIDRIAGEVDKALLSTVPSLAALPGIIASLNPAADMFQQAPPPDAAAEAQEKAGLTVDAQGFLNLNTKDITLPARNALTKKVKEVKQTVVKLAFAEGIVRAAVENFEQPIPSAVLKQCGVSEDDIIRPIRVQPNNEITMISGDTTEIFITGGSGKYGAKATRKIKGLVVSQPEMHGAFVLIETTVETPATQTNVFVMDVAGQSAVIQLNIKKEKGAENGIITPTTFEMSLELSELRQIQTALRICNDPEELTIDGVIGKDTRAAAQKCAEVGSGTFDEAKVKNLKDKYLEDGLPKPGRVTDFEEQAGLPDIKDVYKKVGIATFPTSTDPEVWFTKDFRTKLKDFQQTHDASSANTNKIGISGLYTKDFPE